MIVGVSQSLDKLHHLICIHPSIEYLVRLIINRLFSPLQRNTQRILELKGTSGFRETSS